jgi:hypothetical protein
MGSDVVRSSREEVEEICRRREGTVALCLETEVASARADRGNGGEEGGV